MVKMYPQALSNRVRNDSKNRAEIKMYDLLSEQLGNGWVVFYHVAWLGRVTATGAPRDGETDFIVAHPKHGILLIEVKGGGISYNGAQQQWISRDRSGNDYEIDPFAQVMRCKHALLNKIKSLPGWSTQHIDLGHAVAFPDASVAHIPLPPNAPPEIIIDGHHLLQLATRLDEIMHYWHNQAAPSLLSRSTLIHDLERLLAPTITLPNPLVIQMRDEEQEILRLTEEQFRLLDWLQRTRRAAIFGCAGSGKTMLAVEKACRLANEGFRTLLTCYNKALSTQLSTLVGTKKTELLQVCTFHQLCYRLAQESGIDLPVQDSSIIQQNIFDEEYPDALARAVKARPDLQFDAIIVDEGQDFQDTWWIALEDCLRAGQASIFYVFYDDNQRIYRNRGTIPNDLPSYPLQENVRNTHNIHRVLTTYYLGEHPSRPRGPVGRSVEQHHYSTILELQKLLDTLLQKLLVTEQLASHDVVILTPKSLHRSHLPGLQLNGKFQLVEHPTERPNDIFYSTIHSFKGLERRVAIIIELDEELSTSPETRDALCYVAFSRPRNHLILLGKKDIILELLPQNTL